MKSDAESDAMYVHVACLTMSRRVNPCETLSPSSVVMVAADVMEPDASSTRQCAPLVGDVGGVMPLVCGGVTVTIV